ncbi:DUF3800 domain-containing protein [Chitinophaga sp. SYP-B3965]|uniref:DUF3800 domain-containing protein n=1 Tax=Chitinophaga sp. SYP-B3965 TaxID=2663120 RepID=UPI001299DC80|nr:DUF3800 domain-containing protein [Chitinophaga sp. SYP-B3965]MRG45631.1 DUF3800 domain-containing protein [Chitinophaga sp. SYP-B3965]
MKYCLYMDESGNHGLTQVDESFPVFLLCSVLIAESDYDTIRNSINEVKHQFWNSINVIFHSRDIRKCDKEFAVLFDLEKKAQFYEGINRIVGGNNYTIIASAIRKDEYIKRFGRLANDVYEIALSFIIERAIFLLDDIRDPHKELEIIIEKRGAKEDKQLHEHFQRLMARGTGYVSAERLRAYNLSIIFKSKRENINGLQLADLVAYPIARYVIDRDRPNPSYDAIKDKIYSKRGRIYGLKVYP